MKKFVSSSISSTSFDSLQSAKEKLMLECGCIHLVKMDARDGLVLPDKDKGFHPKFVVIIGCLDDETCYGAVLIQSKPNRWTHSLEQIRADFHPLFKDDYDFIKDEAHNPSYVDCGQIFSFERSRIISENAYKGKLQDVDLQIVISKIKSSERIDEIDKIEYGLVDY